MLRSTVLALMLFAAVTPAFAAWNDPNIEGVREHPLVKFYPQSRVYDASVKDFDSADIVTAYDKAKEGEEATVETVEGKVTIHYIEHKPGTSPLAVVRQYEGALKKAGLTTIVAGKSVAGVVGGGSAFGAFRLDKDGKPAVYVNVKSDPEGEDAASTMLTIVEIKPMQQVLEANSADAYFDALQKTGRVAVYGINFDTAKASLRPESEKVLGEVKALLGDHDDLKLRIEGHTDNSGAAAANKKLSEDRAASVKAWLVKNGVEAARLTTAGFGDAKPVADNATEEGKAKNRRVELVKQ